MRYRPYLQPPNWGDYVRALVDRFGTDFDDPMEEIKKIKQVGSVKDYQSVFERNLTRVNLSQGYAISCFIGGLKPELNIAEDHQSYFIISGVQECKNAGSIPAGGEAT